MHIDTFSISRNYGDIPAILYREENATETVLALHGFGGNKNSIVIRKLAQRICNKGYNVLAIDFPAHGESNADCSQLTAKRCMADILSAEKYIGENFGTRISLFATSFGGFCALNRLAEGDHNYRKIVLRVPAVNMADSLERCVAQLSSTSMEEYRETGKVTMHISKSFTLPYSLYEELKSYTAIRRCDAWNKGNILTIWAENDELVSPDDTKEFLHLNENISNFCIRGADHRMTSNPNHILTMINEAEAFLLDCAY